MLRLNNFATISSRTEISAIRATAKQFHAVPFVHSDSGPSARCCSVRCLSGKFWGARAPRVLATASSPSRIWFPSETRINSAEFAKIRFGITSKPACETHALPRNTRAQPAGFNFVTEIFTDTSRQIYGSRLREARPRGRSGFRIWI